MACIIQNALKTPDGTIIKSVHRHDFQIHDGFFVDGGTDYLRRGYPADSFDSLQHAVEWLESQGGEDLSLSESNSIETIKEKLIWGTRGPKGDQPLKYVKLCQCETDHLEAILDNVPNLDPLYEDIIERILKDRKYPGENHAN